MQQRIAFFALWLISLTVHGQITLNEICPANADVNYDPDFYNFSGWVEFYNAGNTGVSLDGYYLSDNGGEPRKWRIPNGTFIAANGYLLIWCDNMQAGRHTNFELDTKGGEVVFSNPSGIRLDQVSFPKQFTNIAYGRTSNGTGAWRYLAVPTPGLPNNATSGTVQLEKPAFSMPGGKYTSALQLTLTHPNPAAEIRYTLDGSEPTATSTKFTTPITLTQLRVVKAKAFLENFLPGETETQTYFINEREFTLPVISISTKPDYLYNNTIGIYVAGTNGVAGYCNPNPVNWNQDWDRHAVFEYFDKDGNKLFAQSVDVRIGGNCSRGQAQKSLVLKARNKYGSNIMNYKFFPKNVNQFGGLSLRNSGNDFNITMFRDAFMQRLPVDQLDIDYLDYQPTIFFLNGQYMGVQNLREKIDADYIESNYSIDRDNLDLLETWDDYALEGSAEGWLTYRAGLAGMDRATPEAYAYIDQHIDIQEYLDYLVAQIYYANTDWPGNNVKFWRDASVNGKFRWILWDTDFGFGYATQPDHATLNFATATDGPGWPNPPASTEHIRMVLENPVIRARFIQTMGTALNTTFNPDRVIAMINTFQQRIAAEMPYHKTRWGGNMGDWNYEVQRLRDFATQRNAFMRRHLAEFFGLDETVTLSTEVKAGAGKIKMNEITSGSSEPQSFPKDFPVTVEPVADIGYTFKEWRITKRESQAVSLLERGARWKYFDQGSEPAQWQSQMFNDATWSEGPAQLGYGEDDEQTVVSYGPNAANKYITTYFRKTFSVADTVGLQQLAGTMLVDDGAVIYLNGVEMMRVNMPGGTIGYTTLALDGTVEGYYTPFTIPKGIIKPGDNVLAVEVHQNNAASSDLSFDLSLSSYRHGATTQETSTVAKRTDAATQDLHYEVYFEPSASVLINGIVINEISATSTVRDPAGEVEDWIELYNAGTEPVNLAGLYITDNLNNRTKHQLLPGTGSEMLVQPGAYKILWADEDLHQGADHLNFKLSDEGEAVGLYQLIDGHTRMLEEVVFNAQVKEGSQSRIPNATGPFVFTKTATPGVINEIITATEEDLSFTVYPNPVHDQLIVQSANVLHITVVDCLGRTIQSFTNVTGQHISFLHNPPGIYILRIQSGNRLKTLKIVKE